MNYTTLLLLTTFTSIFTSYGEAKTPDPSTLRLAIGREEVATFSKDYLIKKGIDDNDFAKWNALIKTSLGYIKPDKKEKLLPNADRLFMTLDNANAFVEEAVKKLHTAYGKLYVEEKGKSVPRFEKTSVAPEVITHLEKINQLARDFKEKVLQVAQEAFPRNYVDAQPAPDSWIDAFIKDKTAEEIFPGYKKFIADYIAGVNYERFKEKFGNTYGLKQDDEKTFAALLDKIENCKYQLQNKTLSILETKKIGILKTAAADIRREFPTLLSTLDVYKLGINPSMQRTVLSAYAATMEGVLNQIIRETKTLLEAAQAAQKQ